MTEITLSIVSIAVTVFGFYIIFLQIKKSREDAITSSFITAVSEHWLSYEERLMKLRTGEDEVYHPTLNAKLEEILLTDYGGDYRKLAKDYLEEARVKTPRGKKGVFQAISQEYYIRDIILNLDEEEYFIAKELKLVSEKLWDWWEYYIKEDFQSPARRRYWELRKMVGVTHPKFVMFVEEKCIKVKAG